MVFLHEVAPGAAGRSWGVHVAELAGVPAPVVRRAAQLLAALEKNAGPLGRAEAAALPLFATAPEAPPATPPPDEIKEMLAGLDPDVLTPREALEALYRLRALLSLPPPDPALPSRR